MRLIALGVAEGWLSGLYDLATHKWINQGASLHDTLEAAKEEARRKAEAQLKEAISDLEWQ